MPHVSRLNPVLMLLRRSLLIALLASLPAVALLHQPSVATTAEPSQMLSSARTYQLAQIELPKNLPSAQGSVTGIGSLDYPFASIAYGYYRVNQLEKFAIALAKLDRILSLANQVSEAPSRRSAETDLQSAALYRVATAYAQISKLAKALAIGPTIRDLSVQDRARLEAVNGSLDAKTPDQALELARSMQKPELQATALANIADYFNHNQQPEKALPLLDAAFNLTQTTR